MPLTDKITPLILAYNEEPNLGRTLDRLTWAADVLVVDSFSTDGTLDVCRSFRNVRVIQRPFDTFADQCNFGLQHVATEWVLSMDADYVLSERLITEIRELPDAPPVAGYYTPFKYCVFGKPLRATLLPPRCTLYRRDRARYTNDGHAHRVLVDGHTQSLSGHVLHDDRKSLSRWLAAQSRYSEQEAEKLMATPWANLGRNDRLRLRMWVAPVVVPLYCLVLHRGLLDGWHGWYYALQRTLAEVLLALRLVEARRFGRSAAQP